MTRYVLSPDGRSLRPAPNPPMHHPAATRLTPAPPPKLPAAKFTLARKTPKVRRR